MSEEILMNYSTARKYLLTGGLRASKDAILKLQQMVKAYAEGVAFQATENAKVDNNKTILEKHMGEVVEADTSIENPAYEEAKKEELAAEDEEELEVEEEEEIEN